MSVVTQHCMAAALLCVVAAQRSSSRLSGYHLGRRYEKISHEALIWAAMLCYLSSPTALKRSSISFIVPNLHLHSGCRPGNYLSRYVAPTQRNVCYTNTENYEEVGGSKHTLELE